MCNGTVKWFNSEKGYGFLTDETGKDYFVHYSALIMPGYKSLDAGQLVSFELTDNGKGLQAIRVRKRYLW